MKNIFLIIVASLFWISCGEKEQTTEAIVASGDLSAMQKKKEELAATQKQINEQLKLLTNAINKNTPETNLPLVTALKVKDTLFKHLLELQGSVETDQNIVVTPEMSGILQAVYVTEGQKVSKGQTLARVDDGGLSQQVAQMEVQVGLAKTTFERQERLWNQQIGSEIQYLQAKSNYEALQQSLNAMQRQLSKATITAPFSGTIDDVITEKGSVVAAGQTPILRIVSLNDMQIVTDVPETYINDVVVGKDVEVFFPVLNKTIETKIKQSGNFINPNNRTFKIEIEVPNKDKKIKPNLTARLKINDYTNENAILIPQSIISENAQGEQFVYKLEEVNDGKGTAKKVIIVTGKTQGDYIEVLDGLTNGDALIQEGARSVKDGQKVTIITY